MSKAQGLEIFYAIFFLFMILIVVFGFILIPAHLLNQSIKVAPLDNANIIHRFQNKVSYTEPLTLRSYPLTLENPAVAKESKSENFFRPDFQKKWAYKISLGDNEFVYNPRLFDTQKIVAPLGNYYLTSYKKDITCQDDAKLHIQLETILPKVYYVQ